MLLVTVPVGISMALGNALMPLAVKGSFESRPLLGTGVYTTGIQLGSFLAAIVAVPIADVWFGWRGALAAFGVAAALGAAVWLAFAPRGHGSVVDVGGIPRLPVRNLTAWLLVAMFASVAVNYYGLGAWLPNAYQERGWSEGHAALLLAIFNLATVPAGVVVTFLGDRLGSRRTYMVLAAISLTAGTTLLIEVPTGAYAWAFIGGFGNGMMFPLMMTMPLDVSRRAADVSAVTGMMLGFGYSIAALSPFVLGAVRDSTGSFRTSLWLLVAITTVLALIVSQLGPGRLSRGVTVEPRIRAVADPPVGCCACPVTASASNLPGRLPRRSRISRRSTTSATGIRASPRHAGSTRARCGSGRRSRWSSASAGASCRCATRSCASSRMRSSRSRRGPAGSARTT